jgi:hypothetical protein
MPANTWPGGSRRALSQSEHEAWNARQYPGTQQLCVLCDEPTERCEADAIYNAAEVGPLCESCYGGDREDRR